MPITFLSASGARIGLSQLYFFREHYICGIFQLQLQRCAIIIRDMKKSKQTKNKNCQRCENWWSQMEYIWTFVFTCCNCKL